MTHPHLHTRVAILGLLLFLPAAEAIPITYNFVQGGYTDGAILSGAFVAEDRNRDGVIFYSRHEAENEILSSFASYSGSTVVPPFSITAFLTLSFNTSTLAFTLIGGQQRGASGAIIPGSVGALNVSSDGTGQVLIGNRDEDRLTYLIDNSTTAALVTTSTVPEGPSTLCLLSMSIVALALVSSRASSAPL